MKPPNPPAADPVPATLAQLQAICALPVRVQVTLRKQPVTVTGRRLRGPEIEILRELLTVEPPKAKAKLGTGVEPVPTDDNPLADPQYRAAIKAASAKARAFALFACFPIFGEQAPPEVDRRDPAAQARWLSEASGLEPELLEVLYDAVCAEAVQAPGDRVHFG